MDSVSKAISQLTQDEQSTLLSAVITTPIKDLRAADATSVYYTDAELLANLTSIQHLRASNPTAAYYTDAEVVSNYVSQLSIEDQKTLLNVVNTRTALIEHLRAADPSLVYYNDSEILPLASTVELIEKLHTLEAENSGGIVTIGNNISNIFNQAIAVDTAGGLYDNVDLNTLIAAKGFIESLKIPEIAAANLQNISTKGLSALFADKEADEVVQRIIDIAEGRHESGLSTVTLAMLGVDNKPVSVHVVRDAVSHKTLIVTDEVNAATQQALEANSITVVAQSDPDAEDKARKFLRESLQSRRDEAEKLEMGLTYAFMFRSGRPHDLQPLVNLLVDKRIAPKCPVCIVSKSAQPKAP